MSATRNEAKHLEPLEEAKKLFKATLKPRVKVYEDRLALPFYARGYKYLQTGYGEKGYKRTKDFLEKMDDESISRTEKLIDLTKKYTEGRTLPLLLKEATVKVCNFTADYLAIVENWLRNETMNSPTLNRHPAVQQWVLENIKTQTIDFIYKKIIESDDYGEVYHANLSKAVSGHRVMRF